MLILYKFIKIVVLSDPAIQLANNPYFYRKEIRMNIIVTGASQGIGFALVKIFSADQRHRIMAISRNYDSLKNLQLLCRKESGNKIIIISQDLTEKEASRNIEKEVDHHFSGVDILVNCAGLLINKPFAAMDDDDFDHIFSINVKSVFQLVKMLLPYFNKGSHVINISSMGGFQGSVKFPGLSLYSSSKGAVAVLTECMAAELKEQGISLNCLALGSAQSPMLDKAFPGYKAPVSSEEMASFIADFALKGNKYFNGKILPVAVTTP